MIDNDMDMSTSGTERRRLRRSSDQKLAGVCGGIANYFEIDPTIVRIGFVILALIGFGAGVLAYGVMWLVMPDASDHTALDSVSESVRGSSDKRKAVAIVIGGLGLVLLADGLVDIRGGVLLPLVLVAAGVALIAGRDRPPRDNDPSPHTPGPTAASGPEGAGTVEPVDSFAPAVSDFDTGVVPVAYPSPTASAGSGPPPASSAPAADTVGGKPRRAPKPPSVITPTVLSLMVLASGVVLVLDRGGAVDASLVMMGAIWLVLIAAGLLLSTVRGRATGLIFVGIVVVMFTLTARWVDPILDDGTGEVRFAPSTLAELESEYRLGAGELVVDLRNIEVAGEQRELDITLGVGELRVYLPSEPAIDLRVTNDIGNVDYIDRNDHLADINRAGLSNSLDLSTEGNSRADGRLEINIDTGIGNVEVVRVP